MNFPSISHNRITPVVAYIFDSVNGDFRPATADDFAGTGGGGGGSGITFNQLLTTSGILNNKITSLSGSLVLVSGRVNTNITDIATLQSDVSSIQSSLGTFAIQSDLIASGGFLQTQINLNSGRLNSLSGYTTGQISGLTSQIITLSGLIPTGGAGITFAQLSGASGALRLDIVLLSGHVDDVSGYFQGNINSINVSIGDINTTVGAINALTGNWATIPFVTGAIASASGVLNTKINNLSTSLQGEIDIVSGIAVSAAGGGISSGTFLATSGYLQGQITNVSNATIQNASDISQASGYLQGQISSINVPNVSGVSGWLYQSGVVSLDWFKKLAYDNSHIASLDWSGRYLIDNASGKSIDWQLRGLNNSIGVRTVDWQSSTLNLNGGPILDWGNQQIFDNNGANSISWGESDRIMFDFDSNQSLLWGNRKLLAGDGSTVSLDWNNRVLNDGAGTENLNWANYTLGGNWFVDTPTEDTHIANKLYVDTSSAGAISSSVATSNAFTVSYVSGASGFLRSFTTGASGWLQSQIDSTALNVSDIISLTGNWATISFTTGISGYLQTQINVLNTAITGNTGSAGALSVRVSALEAQTGNWATQSFVTGASGYLQGYINTISGLTLNLDGSLGLLYQPSTPLPSVDWGNGILYYPAGGTYSINWFNGQAFASDSSQAINWDSRFLYNALGSQVANWNTKSLIGSWETQSPTGISGIATKGYLDSISGNFQPLRDNLYFLRSPVQTVINSVDEKLMNFTGNVTGSFNIYSTYDNIAPSYIRNTGCWMHAVDLSALSVYNDSNLDGTTGNRGGGVAISDRHVMFADHFHPASGAIMRFLGNDGVVYSRTLSTMAQVGSTDIRIGYLSSSLPSAVAFCSILPLDYQDRFPDPTTAKLPLLLLNANRQAIVQEADTDFSLVVGNQVSTYPLRSGYSIPVVAGDSGMPTFMLIGNQPILLSCHFTAGGGPSIVANATGIEAVMTTLAGTSYSLTRYNLEGYLRTDPPSVLVPSQTVHGRASAGSGILESLTISQVLDFVSTERGSILYRGASDWQALSPTTSGSFLQTHGASADPVWSNISISGGSSGSLLAVNNLSDLQNVSIARNNLGITQRTEIGDTNYTVLTTDRYIGIKIDDFYDGFTADRTFQLPLANVYPTGTALVVQDECFALAAGFKLTLAASGSDLVNANVSVVIPAFSNLSKTTLYSDGVDHWTAVSDGLYTIPYSTTLPGGGILKGDVNGNALFRVRTARGDAGFNVNGNHDYIGLTSLFTAPRIFKLPTASTYPVASPLVIQDESGVASSTNPLIISGNGAYTINGINAPISIGFPYARVEAYSNAAANWSVVVKDSRLGVNVLALVSKSVDYVITNFDNVIIATGTGKTYTLPTAVGIVGQVFTIKNAGTGTQTLNTTSSQTIFSATAVTSITVNIGDAIRVISDGANWNVI